MNLLRFRFLVILAALSLAVVLPLGAQKYDYSYARVVRLSLVDGDVQVSRPGEQAWETGSVNLPIQQGYTVATGQGRAEIEFESGATARLAENSTLQFTELALSNGGRITKLTLTQGTATFYANLAREDSFVVLTPNLQAAIPQNARFRVDASQEGSQVSVLKGDVDVDSSAGTNRLTKGHTLVFHAGDAEQVQVERNAKPDEWDRWVADRDEVVHSNSTAALRYVSSPYNYGLADMYNYGSWYTVGGYGRCWRPFGVGYGWVPYWNGRWVFYRGLGWTWVSYEPWGWLPYHFGNWIFDPSYGWLWVPGFQSPWQPALVTWVRVGNQFGWCPRSPLDSVRGSQPPANLQHGIVTATSSQPGRPVFKRVAIPQSEIAHAQVVQGPPTEIAPALAAHTNTTVSPRVGATGGIVFDPREHRFVNRPPEDGRKLVERGDIRDHGPDIPLRGSSNSTAQPSTQQPTTQRVVTGTGTSTTTTTPPPPPPPRQTTPPPPQQRVATLPPPPRVVTLPPSAKPQQFQQQSIHPMPPHMEPAPRTFSPPPPPPHGEVHSSTLPRKQ